MAGASNAAAELKYESFNRTGDFSWAVAVAIRGKESRRCGCSGRWPSRPTRGRHRPREIA
jgi:hypothetical protein